MTHASPPTMSIRAASRAELDAVVDILVEAYPATGELRTRLVPDEPSRRAVLAPYYLRIATHLLHTGMVEVDRGLDAVALWRRGDDPLHLDEPGYATYLTQTFGADLASRITALGTKMLRHPPPTHHHYLALLAVRPSQQGRGLASALLRYHAAQLDSNRVPAYAHALGPDSQQLLARHGFVADDPPTVALPDGPIIYPMCREPIQDNDPRDRDRFRAVPVNGRRP